MSSSGAIAAMAEPSSLTSALTALAKLATAGVGGGLTYAIAAVETNPEMAKLTTPDLKTGLITLACSVLAFALKSYVPSEKRVDGQFQQQTNLLLTILENRAFGPIDKIGADLSNHKKEMAVWANKTDTRLDTIEQVAKSKVIIP